MEKLKNCDLQNDNTTVAKCGSCYGAENEDLNITWVSIDIEIYIFFWTDRIFHQHIFFQWQILYRFSCCNTCEDVRKAYRIKKWALPDPTSIDQCQNDESIEKVKRGFDEGCQIYGYMEVNRVGGSFHISPGESFSINHMHGNKKKSINDISNKK